MVMIVIGNLVRIWLNFSGILLKLLYIETLERKRPDYELHSDSLRNNIKNNSVLDYIRYKLLNWCGHVQRMYQERLPRRILEWCPPGRRRKGRSRNSCMLEVTTEWECGELVTWIGSTEWWRRKLIYLRHRKMWKQQESV